MRSVESATLISSNSAELELPDQQCQPIPRMQAFKAIGAVAMLIVLQLLLMDRPIRRRESTTKDRRTCAPANERIDLNRTIKEHKVLITEGRSWKLDHINQRVPQSMIDAESSLPRNHKGEPRSGLETKSQLQLV